MRPTRRSTERKVRPTTERTKQAVLGVVARKGKIKVKVAPNRKAEHALPFVAENAAKGSTIIIDEYSVYGRLSTTYKYDHMFVKRGNQQ